MHDGIAALECWLYGLRIGQIANMSFAADPFKIGQVGGLADQDAQVSALIGKLARNMMAYEAGGACNEDFHCLASLFRRNAATGAEDRLRNLAALNRKKCHAGAVFSNNKLKKSSQV